MASVNKAIILGNLGQDPELRYTGGGQAVTTLSIATNERWKDKDGNAQERTEWHRVNVWGAQAELCAKYLTKGRSVYIEGRIQTRSWDDDSGNKRYSTEIVAQAIQFLSGDGRNVDANEDGDSAPAPRGNAGGGNPGGSAPRGNAGGNAGGNRGAAAPSKGNSKGFDDSFNEDDIPF